MHELSIAIGMVEAVTEEAEARGLAGITTVYLRLGPLAGVDCEALRFSFPLACDGTALEGAQLVIEKVPVEISCAACGAHGPPVSTQDLTCRACGAADTRVLCGRELEIRAFEAAQEVSR